MINFISLFPFFNYFKNWVFIKSIYSQGQRKSCSKIERSSLESWERSSEWILSRFQNNWKQCCSGSWSRWQKKWARDNTFWWCWRSYFCLRKNAQAVYWREICFAQCNNIFRVLEFQLWRIVSTLIILRFYFYILGLKEKRNQVATKARL